MLWLDSDFFQNLQNGRNLLSVLLFTAEFATYLNYCRQLRFEDRPDYAYLRGLFKDLYIKEGYDVGAAL